MQVFGGSLAEKFGTKIVLGLANTLTAIMALFIPYVSKLDWQALLILRIMQVRQTSIRSVSILSLTLYIDKCNLAFQGLAESVTYPCLPPMIMRWAPMEERSKFVTFTYFGGTFGTLVTYPICGYLLKTFDWEVRKSPRQNTSSCI